MNDQARYQQTVDNARRRVQSPTGQAMLSRVLDVLLTDWSITGEIRDGRRWVTALHVLTERVLGRRVDTFQQRDAHGVYRVVAYCVVALEAEGLVRVTRVDDALPWKSNQLQRIEIID